MHHSSSHATKNFRVAFWLNLGFTLAEIVGGLYTNSVAILSDAVHDLGDSISLGMAWYLEKLAQRAGDQHYSYGYRRFSLLGAFLTTSVLLVGSVFVLLESIPRLIAPEPANARGMALFAIVGIAVNGMAVLRLRQDKTMSARAIAWHLFEDVLGWIAVLVVSIVLLIRPLFILDAILAIMITLYISWNVVANLRKTLALFLQGVPDNIDLEQLDHRLRSIPDVQSTHHTHVWSLDGEHHVLTTHVVVDESLSKEAIHCLRRELQELLSSMDFSHSTIEIEFGDGDCGMATAD
ncbi:MAG: cation transporter [Anaerolineales bacterium]|nr:MAG: cation transporter [Anaerolineales bacterium]